MSQGTGRLINIRRDEDGFIGGIITCPTRIRPGTGQYLLARRANSTDAVPTAFFPVEQRGGELRVAPPLPAEWPVGSDLNLRGPLGNGFTPPPQSSRWLLISPDNPGRLYPLVTLALDRQADLAWFTPVRPADLPRAVEIIEQRELPEALLWADYLAVDLIPGSLRSLRASLGIMDGARFPCPAQALVRTPLVCGGVAACGLCSVRTRRGWKLACKDGPVFDLDTLEEE